MEGREGIWNVFDHFEVGKAKLVDESRLNSKPKTITSNNIIAGNGGEKFMIEMKFVEKCFFLFFMALGGLYSLFYITIHSP